jgi:MGT family glycosyltransferase
MPKALFFNVPAHGHVNPSLPLVAELVRRGHHITYFITESYRARVEATGAVFQAYTAVHDDYFEARGLDGSRPQLAACTLITTAEEILPELLDTVRRAQPDYILFDGMCPWGQIAAQISGVPAVASLSLMALGSPRILLNWRILRLFFPMLIRDIDKGLEANKRSRALGKKYSIPPLGLASILSAPGDISISYTSSYFQPFASTVSDTIRFVGRTTSDMPAAESFPFAQAQGRPLIYVSLGTVINDAPEFFRTCINALANRDEFVIMSTGNRLNPDSFGELPENISIHSWVPQLDVLKRAALFITHAGLGSVHDGLYFGVPLLLVPQQEEQTLNALRVVELGAGLTLKKAQVNVETIRASVERLLTDPHFTVEAKRIGDTFRAAGGVARAADEIEILLRKSTASKLH